MTLACATTRYDVARRAAGVSEATVATTGVTPGELVIHEIRASVPVWWNRAVLVIVPTNCKGKDGRRFELALYEPDAIERMDAMSMAMPVAKPREKLYAAVEKLLAAMHDAEICFRSGVFLVRRDQATGAMRGEARYEPCEDAALRKDDR
jgi:hypothetical protein